MKIKTIWHYGIMFFESEYQLESFSRNVDNIFYSGLIDDLSYDDASEIAELHPSCLDYYKDAMMPLFKTYGKNKNGTENPVNSIESLKTKKESSIDMSYILIWKIF
jgi:hypothetical protein